MPGIIAFQTSAYVSAADTIIALQKLNDQLAHQSALLNTLPLMIWCDDPNFVAATLNNFLWVTFTRSNPSHDIHGISAFTQNKHWGCRGPLIIDARIKSHHAPLLEKDARVEARVDKILSKVR